MDFGGTLCLFECFGGVIKFFWLFAKALICNSTGLSGLFIFVGSVIVVH